MSASPLRNYQPVWEILKRDKIVSLAVNPHNLGKVKRMISKEKDTDQGFKLMNMGEDRIRLRYKYSRKDKILTVILYQSLGIFEDIIS